MLDVTTGTELARFMGTTAPFDEWNFVGRGDHNRSKMRMHRPDAKIFERSLIFS